MCSDAWQQRWSSENPPFNMPLADGQLPASDGSELFQTENFYMV
jgi:hypothetical protein